MNIRTAALLAFGFGAIMTGSSWAGEIGDQSAEGAASIGAGALSAVSAPLIITAGAVTGDYKLIKKGLSTGVKAPVAIVVGLGSLAGGVAKSTCAAGRGVLHIVHSAGESLAELNKETIGRALYSPLGSSSW